METGPFWPLLVDCLNNIKTLEENGVRFIAVTQGLDTDLQNPASRFLLHVLGGAADYAEPAIMQSHSAENDAVAGFVMIRDSTLSRLKE